MNLRQIEVFRTVMLTGSVTDAARQLHVSQPGISRMLAHIELQLDMVLFERRKGKLLPTPEAQALHAEVEHVYRGVQRIDDCAQALKAGVKLSLNVLVSPSTGQEAIPLALSRLALEFPNARIHVETALARDMTTQLLSQEADIAIATLPLEHTALSDKLLGKWTLACVFPKGHALGAQRIVSPRNILKEKMIAFSPDTPQARIIAGWREKHSIAASGSIEVRSGQTACALAACGAGIAIVDDLTAIACDPRKLDFRPISKSPSFGIFAVTHAHYGQSALHKRFIELAATALVEVRSESLKGSGHQ